MPRHGLALDKAEAVVLLGAGGVGKTSTSAALGIAAAQAGRRVVVLTVDPARRLVETLGLGSTYPSEVVEITEIGGLRSGSLHATMLDAGHTLTSLVDEFAPRQPVPPRSIATGCSRVWSRRSPSSADTWPQNDFDSCFWTLVSTS